MCSIITKEFIFDTFDEAISIHKKLYEIMRQNGSVSYADLYSLVYDNCEITNPEYHILGWSNLWHVKVEPWEHDDLRWVLKMPTIESIRSIKRKGE